MGEGIWTYVCRLHGTLVQWNKTFRLLKTLLPLQTFKANHVRFAVGLQCSGRRRQENTDQRSSSHLRPTLFHWVSATRAIDPGRNLSSPITLCTSHQLWVSAYLLKMAIMPVYIHIKCVYESYRKSGKHGTYIKCTKRSINCFKKVNKSLI